MWTIIWIGLGWLALSVLMAWVWHRLRTSEYRAEYTSREIDQDCAESNLDDADEERDFVMERARLEADREDAEEGRQERLREKIEMYGRGIEPSLKYQEVFGSKPGKEEK